MTAASNASFDPLLRQLWPQNDIWDLLYENNPFFAMVPKDTSFYEKIRNIAVGYGTTQGLASSFSAAKANKSPSVQAEWLITPVTYYSLFSIQRQLMRRAGNKKAAILPALERETRMAFEGWKRRMSIFVWGDGSGSIGVIGSISTNTITLSTLSDIKHYELNTQHDLSSDNTGVAGVRAATSPLIVTGVNRKTGVITFNQNITSAIPGATVGDYIYYNSDYFNVVSGVQAWIPQTDPTSTLFFGLNRTTDTLRLGGVRTSGKGLSPRAAWMKLLKEIYENGGEPTHGFASPNDFLNLQLELQSAGTLIFTKDPGASIDKYQFGTPFEGIKIMGPNGPISIHMDINAPEGAGYGVTMPTWTFATMGDAPYFGQEDGSKILREADSDSFEGRIVGDVQLYCDAPGKNGVVTFNS